MALGDEKYINLTTYKRDGTPVTTPVWAAPLHGGGFGFWTSSGSGKAKRLGHTQRVTVQPSDARGNAKSGTEPAVATARLVQAGDAEYDEIKQRIREKYGLMTHVTKLLGTLGGVVKRNRIPYGDRGVVITLGAPAEPPDAATEPPAEPSDATSAPPAEPSDGTSAPPAEPSDGTSAPPAGA